MNVGGHVQRPFHVFLSTKVLHQHRNVKQHVEVIVEVENPGGWRPGASVDGEVVLEVRRSVVVPPLAVVRRPSGVVVYELVDGVAQERVVRLGVQRADFIEVLEGLEAGATVAVDGASYLTDGAPVRMQEPAA